MNRALTRLLILVIGWLGTVAGWIAAGPGSSPADTAEFAIVLGAAVKGQVPSPVFAGRIDHAVELYRAGRVQRIVFTGGRSDEDQLSEARAGAAYARGRGVPAGAILIEEQSRTTRQNLANAAALLAGQRSAAVLIVSDPLHLRRAVAIAGDIGLNARASPTPHSRYRSLRTRLPFLARETWFMHVHWLLGR